MHSHELNLCLTELVKFLAIDYRTRKGPLSLPVAPQAHPTEENIEMKDYLENEWHTVTKGFKQNDGDAHQTQTPFHQNMCDVLQERTMPENEEDERNMPASLVQHRGPKNRRNMHAVDGIKVEQLNQLIEEYACADRKLKEENKNLRIQLNAAKRKEESANCKVDEMELMIQCDTMLHELTVQEAQGL